MTIEFRCQCGKRIRARDSMGGHKAHCPKCGGVLRIPPSDNVIDVARHFKSDRRTEPQLIEPELAEPDEPDSEVRNVSREMPGLRGTALTGGKFKASSPARLPVSYLRYIAAFPVGFLATHALLLVAGASWLVLGYFSAALILPTMLACFIYWRMLSGKFREGCVNPGIVLSLDPPLVAASTDLRLADGACPVVKVFDQPLHRKTGAPATPGMRVATVANYRGMHEDCGHWFTFLPTVADIVCGNARENERLLASISDEEWKCLEAGIRQLPKAVAPGTWRVFPVASRRKWVPLNDGQLSEIVRRNLNPAKCVGAWPGIREIPPDRRAVIQRAFPGQINLNAILGAWVRGGMSDPQGLVLLILRQGLALRRPGKKPAVIPWDQIRGAFMGSGETQLILINGDRIEFENRGLPFATLAAFENIVTEIVQLPPDE